MKLAPPAAGPRSGNTTSTCSRSSTKSPIHWAFASAREAAADAAERIVVLVTLDREGRARDGDWRSAWRRRPAIDPLAQVPDGGVHDVAFVGHVAREDARLGGIEGLRGRLVHAEGQAVVVVDVSWPRGLPEPVVLAVGLAGRVVPPGVCLGLEHQHWRAIRPNERRAGHGSPTNRRAGTGTRAGATTSTLTARTGTDPSRVRTARTRPGTRADQGTGEPRL
jgi:hypothetical protein